MPHRHWTAIAVAAIWHVMRGLKTLVTAAGRQPMMILAAAASSAAIPTISRVISPTMMSILGIRATVAISIRPDRAPPAKSRTVILVAAMRRAYQVAWAMGAGSRAATRPGRAAVMGEEKLRLRHDVAARLAGPVRLAAEKTRVCRRDRIGAIVLHLGGFLVQQAVATRTKPSEPVDFAGPPLPLDHQQICIGRKARRMRRSSRRIDGRPFGDHGNLLFAVGSTVVQPHLPFDHQHHLVARIDVEFRAVLAAARHEGE